MGSEWGWSEGVLESWEGLVGRRQPDCLRCRLCKPRAILVLGSSCPWPDHIPGLGATRPPAPFRAPFSDPDQPSVCTSSQGLLVWSDPTPRALMGPRPPANGAGKASPWRAPLKETPRSGTEKTTPNLEPDGGHTYMCILCDSEAHMSLGSQLCLPVCGL